MPSAIHYVGYVEEDETPEMIMKKFEELEKVRHIDHALLLWLQMSPVEFIFGIKIEQISAMPSSSSQMHARRLHTCHILGL